MLLMTRETSPQKFMQRSNTSYKVYFNLRYLRPDHLSQGRYKALLFDADSYLAELSRYVHDHFVNYKS